LAETRRKKIHPCVHTYLMYKERAHLSTCYGESWSSHGGLVWFESVVGVVVLLFWVDKTNIEA
jgi:hypothetical protein